MDFNVNVKLDATPALVGAVSTLATAISGCIAKTPKVRELIPLNGTTAPENVVQELAAVASECAASVTATAATPEPVREAAKSDEITDEQLRVIVGPKSKEKGKEAIFAILDEFGVIRVPDLKQDQRTEFLKKLNAL